MAKYIVAETQDGYRPRGNLLRAWECMDHEYMVSGPADTGKTLCNLHKLNALLCLYPGSQAAIIRKVRATLPGTALQTFEKKVLSSSNSVRKLGGMHVEKYEYSNGSEIWVGGIDDPGKALGSERDFILTSQTEEFSLTDWETLTTRCTGRAGYAPFSMLFGDCNPGPPTHWIRQRELKGHLNVINTTHKDNPDIYDDDGNLTEQGKLRLAPLMKLSGSRYMRLFKGLWAAPEGAIYDIYDEERHKVKAFEIPRSWPRIVGIDPFGAYIGALWAAWDPQNKVLHIYREYKKPFGETTSGHVNNILRETGSEAVFAWVGGGPSERQARTDWNEYGIPLLTPPISEVWSQIDKVYDLLKNSALVIHDNLLELLSEIGSYQRVLKDGIPTESIENKDSFHLLDALRYLVAFLTAGEISEVVYEPVQIGNY